MGFKLNHVSKKGPLNVMDNEVNPFSLVTKTGLWFDYELVWFLGVESLPIEADDKLWSIRHRRTNIVYTLIKTQRRPFNN